MVLAPFGQRRAKPCMNGTQFLRCPTQQFPPVRRRTVACRHLMSDDPPFRFEINCRWLAPTGCFTCSLGCHGNQLIKDARPKVIRWPISSNFSLLTHRFQSVNLGLFADFLIHLSAEFLEKKFSSANIEAGTWVELFELFLDFFFPPKMTANQPDSGGTRLMF